MTNIKKVHRHLQCQGMLDCFMLVQPTPLGPDDFAPQQLNLLADYDTITEVQVTKSVEFFSKYSQDYDLENLDWSQKFLGNLCSEALIHKVEERMDRLNKNKCGRPMFFYIMMEILSSMSAEVKWALINCMKKLSLCDFEGEDFNALSTIILGIIKRLKMLNSVPKD
eukprot:5414135-Ditylum_brightwellii.AAC.1